MKILFRILLAVLGVTSGLIGTEMLLRLLGESPGTIPTAFDPANFAHREPFTTNIVTGWQLKPGSYRLVLGNRGRATEIAINLDGSRKTREFDGLTSGGKPNVIFLGDSFVFGHGLDDEETLPWHLQEFLPHWNVINHAVSGYGTCQAFLRLQQLEVTLNRGDFVIYGLSGFHEERNTADPRQDYWAAISSPSHQSGYPQCQLVNNAIVSENSKVWEVVMPLTGRSVLSRILTDVWLSFLARSSTTKQRPLTEFLLKGMNKTSTDRGAFLIVLLQELSGDAQSHYRAVLDSARISYVDGTDVNAKRNLKLPDGHPGPEVTKVWAKQLRDHLVKQDSVRD
jgi:hypothetical protein